MPTLKRLLLIFCMLAAVGCNIIYFAITSIAHAQTDESVLKAEWLYTLIPYLKWKDRPYKDITICTIGREPVNKSLEDLIKREEPKSSVNIEKKSFESDLRNCHILYISTSESKKITDIFGMVEGKQILTVSSIENFADNGGIIEFVTNNDGVALRVNEKPAEKAHIVIDSDLLGFAERVYK